MPSEQRPVPPNPPSWAYPPPLHPIPTQLLFFILEQSVTSTSVKKVKSYVRNAGGLMSFSIHWLSQLRAVLSRHGGLDLARDGWLETFSLLRPRLASPRLPIQHLFHHECHSCHCVCFPPSQKQTGPKHFWPCLSLSASENLLFFLLDRRRCSHRLECQVYMWGTLETILGKLRMPFRGKGRR